MRQEASICKSAKNKSKYKEKQKQFYRSEKTKGKEENREIVLQKYLLSFIFQNENPYQITSSLIKIINIVALLIVPLI